MQTNDLPYNIHDCACTKIWFILRSLVDCTGQSIEPADADRLAETVAERMTYPDLFHIACHRMDPSHPAVGIAIALTAAMLTDYTRDRSVFYSNSIHY